MLRRAGLAVIATAILLASLVAAAPDPTPPPGPPLSADGCPASWPGHWFPLTDRPGPLVSARDVVAVSYCQLGLGTPSRTRRLTMRPEAMVAAINALPTRREIERIVREREAAQGRKSPADLHLGQACTLIGYGDEVSFSVQYADRPPEVVLMDRNCGTVRASGRTRFLYRKPIDTFLTLYRAQLEKTATQVPPPPCAEEYDAARTASLDLDAWPVDGVAANRGDASAFLPSRLTGLRACRYSAEGGKLKLTALATPETDLEQARSLLNSATEARVKVEGGGMLDIGQADCHKHKTVDAMDVLWVADATGAVAEARIWRRPCEAVLGGRTGPRTLPEDLETALDAWV